MKTLSLLLAVGTLCSIATAQQSAAAQPAPGAATAPSATTGAPEAPNAQATRFFDTEIGLNADYAFRSDVDTGGDVAVTRSMLSLWLGHDFCESFRGTLLVTSEYSWYDFKNATALIPGTQNPFSQLAESDVTLGGQYKINQQWTAIGGIFVRWAGENDADLSDSFTWGGYGAAKYTASKDFSVTLGVRVNTRLEDDTVVLPAIAMDWSITDKVKLQVIPAVGGMGARVTSQLNDQFAFLIDSEYQTRSFRLDDTGALPDGVVRDSRVQLGMGVVWTPTARVHVTARAGAIAWQEFDIDNRTGAQVTKANTDPTPYIFVGGTIDF